MGPGRWRPKVQGLTQTGPATPVAQPQRAGSSSRSLHIQATRRNVPDTASTGKREQKAVKIGGSVHDFREG